jgi:Zn-dependent protease
MGDFLNWPPTWGTLWLLPGILVGFTVHELAHALVAYLLGDTSQVERKRLTFNPFRHISWLGMAAFLLLGFGWAKPVWVDYARLRVKNRPFGMFLVSVAGATANLLTALAALVGMTGTVVVVSALSGTSPWEVLVLLLSQQPGPDAMGLAVALTSYMLAVNLILAVFNMLPLPPLDGFQAVMSLFAVIRNALKGRSDDVPLPGLMRKAAQGEAQPHSPARIHFDIGLEYQKAGQIDEAIARYRQAIAHDEHFAPAYYNEGLAYWAKGRRSLAASAFRAAMQAGDTNVRVLASLRLQELSQADTAPEAEPGPVPPPLESGTAPEVEDRGAPSLDPAVERRVWLRLGIGGLAMLLLAAGMWLYVTTVLLMAVGWPPAGLP